MTRVEEVAPPLTRDGLHEGAARILDAMVWLETKRIPMPWSRTLVAIASDMKPRAGYFKGKLAGLKASGLVSYPVEYHLCLEHRGRQLGVEPGFELTLETLHDKAKHLWSYKEHVVLARLFDAYPESVARGEIDAPLLGSAEKANALAKLRAAGLVSLSDPQRAVAEAVMFPAQLVATEGGS